MGLPVIPAERLVNRCHYIPSWADYNHNMPSPNPESALSMNCCSATLSGGDFRGGIKWTDVAHQKRKDILTSARMTIKEVELFIKCMDVVRDAKGTPLRRRYSRSDGSIIAEAKWATVSEVEEAKSPILVMAEEEAIKVEQGKRR